MSNQNQSHRAGKIIHCIATAVIGIAVVVLFFVVLAHLQTDYKKIVLTDQYELKKVECSIVEINGAQHPNVRSEPRVLEDRTDGGTNSFGAISANGYFTMKVSCVYKADSKTANGIFYGILVSDILSTEEGRTWFPKGIENDLFQTTQDGDVQIVWIAAGHGDEFYIMPIQ